jgi:hypothetical protein
LAFVYRYAAEKERQFSGGSGRCFGGRGNGGS